MRGQPEVVEDGADRGAVALVQVDQELHRLDLVAKVQVDRRLVEEHESAPPGRRRRPAGRVGARRAKARERPVRQEAPRPTRSIAAPTAARSAARNPRIGSSCGSRPSATTSSTRIAKGSVAAGTADTSRAIAARDIPWTGRPSSSDAPAANRHHPAQRAQQRGLAGAVRAHERNPLAPADREGDPAQHIAPAVRDRDVVEFRGRGSTDESADRGDRTDRNRRRRGHSW